MRRWLLVDEPPHGLDTRDAGADEDRAHHEEPGDALRTLRLHQECDPERDGCQRVAEVVDQVREQRDAARQHEDGGLRERSDAEHAERDQHRAHSFARPLDAVVDKTV